MRTVDNAKKLSFDSRFEGVGEQTHVKLDPTLKKSLSRNELGIIVLFAAANGDLLTLKRFASGVENTNLLFFVGTFFSIFYC